MSNFLKQLTRDQRLLMSLARASSAGKQSRQLEVFFEGLDAAGWFIEIARVHLRLSTGVALPHGTFAQALQLPAGRAYRLALTREDELRGRLVDVARAALTLEGDQAISRLQRTMEYARFQRSLSTGTSYGRQRRGRKLGETFYVSDPIGEELEELRVQSGLTLKEWAVHIGTSENTYRRRLDERLVPPEWLEAARMTVSRRQETLLAYRAQENRVSDFELVNAFTTAWRTYQVTTGQFSSRLATSYAAPETPEQKAARQAREDADLLQFTPSAEEDDELDLDVGAVDETDRAQPENLDESVG